MNNNYFSLDNDKLIGIWENKNIVPFAYDDGINLTLMFGNVNNANFQIDHDKFEFPQSVFLENIEIINQNNENRFLIRFVSSNDGNVHEIHGRMHITSFPPAFILSLPKYGERYFEKVSGSEFVGN